MRKLMLIMTCLIFLASTEAWSKSSASAQIQAAKGGVDVHELLNYFLNHDCYCVVVGAPSGHAVVYRQLSGFDLLYVEAGTFPGSFADINNYVHHSPSYPAGKSIGLRLIFPKHYFW